MSTTKTVTHTAGPWHYCKEPNSEPYEFYVRESVTGLDSLVAHVRFNCPESESNARLIAAAPRMLEALEKAEFYLNLIKPATLGGEGIKAWEARTAVEAAIRAAKGEL